MLHIRITEDGSDTVIEKDAERVLGVIIPEDITEPLPLFAGGGDAAEWVLAVLQMYSVVPFLREKIPFIDQVFKDGSLIKMLELAGVEEFEEWFPRRASKK